MSDTPNDPGRDVQDTNPSSDSGGPETKSATGSTSRDPDTTDTQTTSESGAGTRTQRKRDDTDEKGRARVGSNTLKWLSGVVALIGAWIAASPFLYETTGMALWNNVAVGVAILLLAGFNFYRMHEGHRPNVSAASLVALLGLWAIIAPFLLEYPTNALIWSTTASGIAAAVLSGYNAYEGRRTEDTTAATARA